MLRFIFMLIVVSMAVLLGIMLGIAVASALLTAAYLPIGLSFYLQGAPFGLFYERFVYLGMIVGSIGGLFATLWYLRCEVQQPGSTG